MNNLVNELIESVDFEIKAINKNLKKKKVNVEFYKLLKEFNNIYVYEIYVSEFISNMVEDIEVELKSVKHNIKAVIVEVKENQILVIKTKEKLTEEIYRINIEFNPTFILESLKKNLSVIDNNKLIQILKNKLINNSNIFIETINTDLDKLNSSQLKAIEFSEKNQFTIIWGPPGTGKTYTLAKIIFRSYLRNEKVLVVSTSNAAVDQILKKLDKELYDDEKDDIYRMGNSVDKICHRYTKDYENYKETEKSVIFSTLAKCSLEFEKIGNFDLVVIDEISMISLPFIFLAVSKSKRNVVMLGDFKQLPPISISENKYFKENIFDYLDISKTNNIDKFPYMVMLDTQYRMNKTISELISSLFYQNKLKCGVELDNENSLNFINLDGSSYNNTYFSVKDESYFNPISLFVIDEILREENLDEKDILILSPFRPQQNLINAYVNDKNYNAKSLTIHKAQGSEAEIVIFDLTTHKKTNLTNFHYFFMNDITQNLVNVALSRAKTKLYIIGSLKMLESLSLDLWKKLLLKIKSDFNIINYDSFKFKIFDFKIDNVKNFTVLDMDCDRIFLKLIRSFKEAQKRNYITIKNCIPSEERKEVTFKDVEISSKLPYMVFIDDKIILKEHSKFIYLELEKTSKILQRITLEHLISDSNEIKRSDTFNLNCDKCGFNFILKNKFGIVKLYCPKCHNEKFISKRDAILLKELYKIKCPICGADVEPRKRKGQSYFSFFGCKNYPHCRGTISFKKLID